MRDSFQNIFRFRFIITLAFLLFGCGQVSVAMSGVSEVFAMEVDSLSDSTSASWFVGFGGGFYAGIFLALPFPFGPDFPFPTMARLWPDILIVKYAKLFRTKSYVLD